jgi:hypothetical protein
MLVTVGVRGHVGPRSELTWEEDRGGCAGETQEAERVWLGVACQVPRCLDG